MNLFRTLKSKFAGRDTGQLKLLEQGIGLLRLSTINSLQKRYSRELGPEMANTLAVAVVSVMILEPPGDQSFSAFYDRYRSEIGRKAQEVRRFEDISGPSGCASYLFAAEILHSAMVKASCVPDATKSWKSGADLEEQAANLGIYLPSTLEICGSEERGHCIDAIHSFAKAFYYANTWIGASPALTAVPLPSIPHDYDFLSRTLLHPGSALLELPAPAHTELEGDDAPALFQLRLP